MSSEGIDDFYREVGSRIRQHRSERPLTQQELAERVGLSRAAIANIELGRQRIALHMLLRFADALGVPPGRFLPVKPVPDSEEPEVPDLSRLRPRDQQTVLRVMSRARQARAASDA